MATRDQRKQKVRDVIKEFRDGNLKTTSGDEVKDFKQALAIAFSEADALGDDKDGD